MGRRFKREGTYVSLWQIHAAIWQEPTQYHKAIIFQLKINKFLKKSCFIFKKWWAGNIFGCHLKGYKLGEVKVKTLKSKKFPHKQLCSSQIFDFKTKIKANRGICHLRVRKMGIFLHTTSVLIKSVYKERSKHVPKKKMNSQLKSLIPHKKQIKGFSGGLSGKESTCQCWRQEFYPRSRKIPRAVEQLSQGATTIKPVL